MLKRNSVDNFLYTGVSRGCPPLLQWGVEDVYTVRRGAQSLLFWINCVIPGPDGKSDRPGDNSIEKTDLGVHYGFNISGQWLGGGQVGHCHKYYYGAQKTVGVGNNAMGHGPNLESGQQFYGNAEYHRK